MWREAPLPTRPPEVPGTASPWLYTGRWCPGSPSVSGHGSGCCSPGSCPRASVGRPELRNRKTSWNPAILQKQIFVLTKPPLVLVVGEERFQFVNLTQGWTWTQREAVLRLPLVYCTFILGGGKQADISKLSDWHFDLLDGFVRVILETNWNY